MILTKWKNHLYAKDQTNLQHWKWMMWPERMTWRLRDENYFSTVFTSEDYGNFPEYSNLVDNPLYLLSFLEMILTKWKNQFIYANSSILKQSAVVGLCINLHLNFLFLKTCLIYLHEINMIHIVFQPEYSTTVQSSRIKRTPEQSY